ncbi:DUF1127 domain-containing protein [Aestuariivirga sp.]|uniref:DUF1127 domain-containing protein n=1 Tax=Aestuariivirga sp. TaxID=2650926 RepID=UPI0039E33BC6
MTFNASAKPCGTPRNFNTLFGRIGEWMRHRRDTRRLESLSDEQLKDIGVSRAQIEALVRRSVSPF